jgi:chemotaxis protein MotA
VDISTIIGLVLAILAIVMGVGSEFGAILDTQSFFITVIGSIGGTFIAHPKGNGIQIV